MATTSTHFFNASDAGPTDSGADWTSDSNAFDGSESTSAQNLLSAGSLALTGTGTNAAASGPTISSVSFRSFLSVDDGTAVWTSLEELTVPSGGWSWMKVQALHVEMLRLTNIHKVTVFESDGGTSLGVQNGGAGAAATSIEVLRVEVVVTHATRLIILPTNAETDRYNFGYTASTVIALGKPERTSDATLLGTYYFDASDAGPTDTSAGWTNDANAFNNSLSDFANSNGILGRALTGEGTTAPTSGSTIGEVVVVVSLEAAVAGGPDTIILVSEDSVGGTLLGTTTFAQWGFDLRKFGMDLTAPSGGWTWQKVNDLAISFDSDSTDCNIYRAQVLVYADDASADEEYLMILATGDDDAETWTTPTGWTEFFQVNDTGGDDASIAGWYIKESSALPVTELVRGIEEGVAVMFTVEGADQATLLGTYYFDASDAGPTDTGADWTDDANAFDGSLSTFAIMDLGAGALTGEGTTAPTSGDAIDYVEVRIRFEITENSTGAVFIFAEDTVGGTELGRFATPSTGITAEAWSNNVRLTAPSGGWTWQKVNDLTASFNFSGVGVPEGKIWEAEVTVYSGGFEDLAYTASHFVSTLNVDGTPNITPQPITTVTDGAVVIIMTGNRSDAGHLNSSGAPRAWHTIAPSGYTIEAIGTIPGTADNTMGAPGRLEQGAGNGDAQMTWMWKTVTSLGTETPADITGFALGKDMKTVTFAIRPAVTPPFYPPFPRIKQTTVRM